MKLHVLSDLHLGCAPFTLSVKGDALILAGDITDGNRAHLFTLCAPYTRRGLPVFFVPGNHEFYGRSLAGELRALERSCRRAGIELLHNRVVSLDGVRFIGTTLWTDFALYSDPVASMQLARRLMADFSVIAHRNRTFTPEVSQRMHFRALRFLERAFRSEDGPAVVITHHGPHPQSIHARFQGNAMNPGFVSDLSDRIARWRPALWVHGHVHNRFDYRVGSTRVVANPRGYDAKVQCADGTVVVWPEHPDFDPNLTIEIPNCHPFDC
jgi:Icc-related predicted phosphoesterase